MARSFTDFVPRQRFQPTVAVSPDGATVAYSTNVSGQYQLWVVPTAGGEATQLTHSDEHAVRQVAWSPDGGHLAFTADRDGDEQFQVYLISRAGGEPRRVTTALDRQHVLADAPFGADGSSLLYAANDRDPSIQEVLIHPIDGGATQRITSEPGVMLFPVGVSPDGRWLAVEAARSNSDGDAWVVDLTDPDLVPRNLTAHDGEQRHVPGPWTHDSGSIVVRTDAGGEFTSLVAVGLAGRETSSAGESPDEPQVETVFAVDWDVEQVTATADGTVLAWTVNDGGRSVPYVRRTGHDGSGHDRIGHDGSGHDEVIEVPAGEIESLTITDDGSTLVMLVTTPRRPTELVAVDIATGALRHLTDSRPIALADADAVAPDLIAYETHDGRDVPAWLYRPDGAGPFPVVVAVHGGPEAQERPVYAGLYQFLLANGVGVLAPNIRGSTGYGTTYQRLIHRDWGGAELGDLGYAARHLATLDWVDPARLGVIGGSFGGFAALSCLSRQPDLWAAGVSIVGPSNLVTFVRSVPPTWRPLMATWIGDPDADAEMLTARSPLTYVDDVRAPLFVIQGAMDPRVVRAESDQMVEALRRRGVEVRYDVYDDEGHGFTRRHNEIRALGDAGEFLVDRLCVSGAS